MGSQTAIFPIASNWLQEASHMKRQWNESYGPLQSLALDPPLELVNVTLWYFCPSFSHMLNQLVFYYTGQQKQNFSLLGFIWGDSYQFDHADSENHNIFPLSRLNFLLSRYITLQNSHKFHKFCAVTEIIKEYIYTYTPHTYIDS